MAGEFAWDTNIVIGYFDSDASILAKIATADQIAIPSIVLGELYFGAGKSKHSTANIRRIDKFRDQNFIVNCDAKTAEIYGLVRNELRVKGKPIPDNDVWIAALTIQHNLILVTRDAHFNEIDSLSLEAW